MVNKKKKSSKPRSAKQKAADKKNGARLKKYNNQKKKGIKSKVKRAASKVKNKVGKRKTNKPRKKPNGVKGLKSITSSSTLKKVALGVGGAAIASAVIGMVAPNSQFGRYAAPAGAYVMGGIEGIIGSMALSMFSRPNGNANVAPALEVL
jgi:hypothetical protein